MYGSLNNYRHHLHVMTSAWANRMRSEISSTPCAGMTFKELLTSKLSSRRKPGSSVVDFVVVDFVVVDLVVFKPSDNKSAQSKNRRPPIN
jgi:hypothetical protein